MVSSLTARSLTSPGLDWRAPRVDSACEAAVRDGSEPQGSINGLSDDRTGQTNLSGEDMTGQKGSVRRNRTAATPRPAVGC